MPFTPTRPAELAMVTMWPFLRLTMPGKNALVTHISAIVLILMVSSERASSASSSFFPATIPALLIKMSTRPHFSRTCAAVAYTMWRSATSTL
jgi:hypothetical protein